jgi:hypothetical protein
MKNTLLIVGVIILVNFASFGQGRNTTADYTPVRNILTNWDQIRGDWLTSSLAAIANDEAIPDRTFPEPLTPYQLFAFVPENSRTRVVELMDSIERSEVRPSGVNFERGINIVRMLSMISRPTTIRSSWTFGDPHIVSFDKSYHQNFQVGEFVLAKSKTSDFEIQARFETINEDASFTTAVSMSVNGDIVAIYAGDKPDDIQNSALRVNGEVVLISNPTYYLPKGGTISYSNGAYTVNWASGEASIIEFENYMDKKYLNVAIQINAENESDHTGLSTIQSTGDESEVYASARIEESTSLFSYNQNRTAAYYSRSHHKRKKVTRLDSQAEVEARKVCLEAGVSEIDLEGSIYDYGHFSIPPSLRPEFTSPVDETELVELSERVLNTNSTKNQLSSNRSEIPEEDNKEVARRERKPIDGERVEEVVSVVGRVFLEILNSGIRVR